MSNRSESLEKQDVSTLVAQIVQDSGTLLSQHMELLRAEVRQEVRRAGEGAATMAAGGALSFAGGILTGMMVAHLLHRATKLPLWVCYGAAGGSVGAAGLALLQEGKEKLANVHLVPTKTTEAVKENVEWLKEQLTPGSP